MTLSTLVVGQAPAKASEQNWVALDPRSASGRRLAAYAGLDPHEMHLRADFVNLLSWFPGRVNDGDKYDAFDTATARQLARMMVPRLWEYRRVVFLGRAVSDAFTAVTDLPRLDWFEPHYLYAGTIVYASPHPAGTSMFWNDPVARAAGEAFWRSVLAAPEKSS